MTTFFYLKPLKEYKTVKPYHINVPQWALSGHRQSNEVSGPVSNIPVRDIRGREKDFSLDRNGFQIFKETDSRKESMTGCLTYEDYADPEKVMGQARLAVESFLKRKLGAEVVVAFSHQVRQVPKTGKRCPLFEVFAHTLLRSDAAMPNFPLYHEAQKERFHNQSKAFTLAS